MESSWTKLSLNDGDIIQEPAVFALSTKQFVSKFYNIGVDIMLVLGLHCSWLFLLAHCGWFSILTKELFEDLLLLLQLLKLLQPPKLLQLL